jgi:hypothetical protein
MDGNMPKSATSPKRLPLENKPVRITPYRNVDNIIDGLVITFMDVSDIHVLKAGMEESLSILQYGLDKNKNAGDRLPADKPTVSLAQVAS